MIQDLLVVSSGSIVGFALGLVGGGGSILAVPLLVYVVGIQSVHLAVGTSSVGVAVSALSGLLGHARAGNVRWPCALVFAASGAFGATLGAALGKLYDGQRLLALFGILMVLVAAAMLPRRSETKAAAYETQTAQALLPRLISFGAGTGLLSGFFGIGGGFLIAPSLKKCARLSMLTAIGSSLVAVSAFGLTTATSYAASGLVDWRIASLLIVGGITGSLFGRNAALHLAGHRNALCFVFAGILAAAGLVITLSNLSSLLDRGIFVLDRAV